MPNVEKVREALAEVRALMMTIPETIEVPTADLVTALWQLGAVATVASSFAQANLSEEEAEKLRVLQFEIGKGLRRRKDDPKN